MVLVASFAAQIEDGLLIVACSTSTFQAPEAKELIKLPLYSSREYIYYVCKAKQREEKGRPRNKIYPKRTAFSVFNY